MIIFLSCACAVSLFIAAAFAAACERLRESVARQKRLMDAMAAGLEEAKSKLVDLRDCLHEETAVRELQRETITILMDKVNAGHKALS